MMLARCVVVWFRSANYSAIAIDETNLGLLATANDHSVTWRLNQLVKG